jgi:hypothetical protein
MARTVPRPLLVLLLGFAACAAARGQPLAGVELPGPGERVVFPGGARPAGAVPAESPLDAKDTARSLRQAQTAAPDELRREVRGAARAGYDIRLQRIRGGTDTPDVTLEDLARLLPVDLALAKTPAERVTARVRYWAGCREVELLTLERVAAGIKAFTAADYWAARTERLLAEFQLVQEIGGAGMPLPASLHSALHDPDPIESWAPRAEFAASRAAPRELARAAQEACTREYARRIRRIMAGTDTPDVLLEVVPRRVAAARAAGEEGPEFLATLEGVWLLSWDAEQLTRERVEAGVKQFSRADYYDSRADRLGASAQMAEARRVAGKPLALTGGLQDPFAVLHDDPLDTRDLARAKAETVRADISELNRQRRAALLAGYEQSIQRVRSGTDTPDVTGAVSRRLLDVELALAGQKRADRLAALERQLARAAEIEALVRECVEAGVKNFTPADFWEARYERLRAELQLAETRAAKTE